MFNFKNKGKAVLKNRNDDEEEQKRLTEASDHEANDEIHETTQEYLFRRSLERKIRNLKIAVGLLSVCIFGLLLLQGPYAYQKSRSRLIPSPVPPLTTTRVVFEKDELYARRPDPESDAAWDALLPPGRGFVFIPNPHEYGLPPGEATPYGDIYSIAVFHQLHCLGQLRRFTWLFLDSIAENGTHGELTRQAIMQMFNEGDHAEHLHHCFDYLRQTIMCGGDMSVEWPRDEPDGRRFAVDGWGIPHECKNWDTIMEYMDQNHFNMSTNTEIAPLGGNVG
ncbi:hypothetical protein, variant [Verruconis gallopava]|uniref:Oxidase ustYa n=1 Tax=Verruconis gallopava TaxID=253628 RepID=A0A0D2AM73_9PEZI|nr:uncharacterized protein PV09_01512 [Verruconis gallopava]XP_016217424.1 hypothetical protein, variant [Verruconis gallopava]KIW07554.1 hypothetical protein PV09_01512 [Verruconis gallopava]KIW07555.1 hypothetical protein, variant [Verruconis gallopava]